MLLGFGVMCPLPSVFPVFCGGCGVGAVVGNCIVDASIFGFFVSVLGRSVDALAHVADEGRCSLRYSSGSWQTSCDPRVSEWGNPAGVVSGYPHLNV